MNKYVLVLISIVMPLCSTLGQEKWSLKDCIEYAIENNIEVMQRKLAIQSAEIDLNSSKNERLPDFNGSISQNFNFGRSQMSDGVYQSVNSNSTSLGVNTSIPIFTGFRIKNNIEVQKYTLLSAIEEAEKTKDNIELNVTGLYLDVLFKNEMLAVYELQVLNTELQLEKTIKLVESGKLARSQQYDMVAQLAKDNVNLTMAKNDLSLSLLNLSQSLNLPSSQEFDIVVPSFDSLTNPEELLLSPKSIFDIALQVRSYSKSAEYNVEARKKSIKVAQSGYYPSLTLGGGYSTNYNSRGNDAFFRQLKNLGSEYISLSLNIPIFNKFQTRNQVRLARLNLTNSELNLQNIKQSLYKEIQQSYQQAQNAQIKYKSTEKALIASQESYDYAKIRYDVGQMTAFELNDAQMKMTYSRAELVQAKYEYIFRNKILNFYRGEDISLLD